MQVVIALPAAAEIGTLGTPVCGVPLLSRVIATALRGGGSKVLLVVPPGWSHPRLVALLGSPAVGPASIETVDIGRRLDPCEPDDWRCIAPWLDDRFLWMPCDYLVHRQALSELLSTAAWHPGLAVRFSGTAECGPGKFEKPAVLLRRSLLDGAPEKSRVVDVDGSPGVSVRPHAPVREAEAELVRRSGKATDGIYSRFNRRLCRPAVRWLSHTPVTPNAVSFGGLAVAVLAGLCFAQGSWPWDVTGAALFFISGLFDEIDGMLARLRFQESAFGCWLETMADYSSYLLIFAGMTIGGYRRDGWAYIVMGAALLCGSLLSFIVISIQRKLAAPAGKPNEYSRRYLAALDRDAGNPVSRAVRQLQFLTKKGVLIHYLLLFTVVGALPAAMFLSAVAANIAWAVTIYFNRRLFSSGRLLRADAVSRHERPVEVGK